jgi:hypothetical protein
MGVTVALLSGWDAVTSNIPSWSFFFNSATVVVMLWVAVMAAWEWYGGRRRDDGGPHGSAEDETE